MSVPKTTKAWTIEGQNGFDSLKFNQQAPVSPPGDYEVLVKFHAASLNYRDLIIPKCLWFFQNTSSESFY
jgi:NADPH:quinone reductase-like Zn-dependent oxidoreductase